MSKYNDCLDELAVHVIATIGQLGYDYTDDDLEMVLQERTFLDVAAICKQKLPRKSGKGFVEYEGAGYFFDWSGDLASAPIEVVTGEPDPNEDMWSKVCDYNTPMDDALAEAIMEMIE